MTDWLGMAPPPRSPHPDLKARVLGRALRPRLRVWPLAAAALVLLVGGSGGYWAARTIRALGAERDTLATHLAALQDTVNSFIHGTATRLVQVSVSTGGRLGAVTIFADSALIDMSEPPNVFMGGRDQGGYFAAALLTKNPNHIVDA